MYFIQPQLQSRRAFLRRAGQLAFTGAALPTAINLAALGEAAAFSAGNDYKALVCVFLYGGNDYANTLIPYDASNYAAYQAIRGTAGSEAANGIALAKAALTPMLLSGNPSSAIGLTGLQYAMHPSMTGLRDLFTNGRTAIMLNFGPLVAPITKTQYENKSIAAPPKLFSHNDQQSIWQSSSPEGSTVGWGGNIGDLAMSSNSSAGGNSLFTCISVTGNAVFLSGDTALSYQVGTEGAVRINSMGSYVYGFSNNIGTALRSLGTTTGRAHWLENEYSRVTQRAVNAEGAITAALASTAPTNSVFPTPFNNFPAANSLASQLRMVARLIAARDTLKTKRQVFMVSLGGFDLHDGLIANHDRNMSRVSNAMKAFDDTMVALGMGDKVTSFTASDFGRTLSSNGDGSDHGWGGHQFVVGGAVNGGYYGYAPPVSVAGSDYNDSAAVKSAPENQWHVGQGRLLPTTGVDQFAATLAKWFGVSDTDLVGSAGANYNDAILPFLHNFGGSVGSINYARNLGFMKAP
jgi:uncharacterized protein (DUF1501 family)